MNDDIKLIKPIDWDALNTLAGHMAKPKIRDWFWEDALRVNPLVSFAFIFANPANVVLDLGNGHGVLAFASIAANWRASLYAATWGPRATRNPPLWRRAIAIAMEMHNLLIVEAITREDNRSAIRALDSCGFKYRGSIPDRLCYNGTAHPASWWEIARETVGLEPR